MDLHYKATPRSRAAPLGSLLVLAACASAPAPASPPAVSPAPAPSPTEAELPPKDGWPGPLQKLVNAARAGLCQPSQLRAAHSELNEISGLIKALPDDMSTATDVTTRINRLLASPCFGHTYLLDNLDQPGIQATRAAALKLWWQAARNFLGDALEGANAVHLVPSLPRVLSPELLPTGDPLRTILCPAVNAVCDPLAEGATLDLRREIERVAGPHHGPFHFGPDTSDIEACARAKHDADDDPLSAYIRCVRKLAPEQTELPVAHFRSPKGWLVMQGRRGHHQFCDEVRAYDLATGAAYIASRCGGLVLVSNGHVDHDRTSRQSTVTTMTGTVSVDALRHLALALWLKDSLVKDVQPAARFPLPTGVPMPTDHPRVGGGGGSWGSSSQTAISFRILDGGHDLHTGTFTWPDSADTGDQIADDLVVAAEATFQPGCPPAALPAALAQTPPIGGVSPIDASAESLRASTEALTRAMAGLRSGRVCRTR